MCIMVVSYWMQIILINIHMRKLKEEVIIGILSYLRAF